jgi:hypothetical protein
VTLKIEASLLREVQVLAAREGSSIKDLLTSHLEQAVRKRKQYRQGRRSALARLKSGYDLNITPLRSRDKLHQRTSN